MQTRLDARRSGTSRRTSQRAWVSMAQSAAALVIVSVFAVAFLPGESAASESAPATHATGLTAFAGPASVTRTSPRVTGSSAQFASRNWDGYITYVSSEGTDFHSVQSTWVQPTVTCPKPNAWTVFWVGLDGWWDDTVEQGGTSAECIDGVPQYESWWEMYPTNAITTEFAISAGDKITSSVTYVPSTSTFVIKVSDTTSSQSFTMDEQCATGLSCERSSADVIAEDVGEFGSGSYFPLADYHTMKFAHSTVTDDNGSSGTFTNPKWLNAAVTEKSSGTTYATVSKLNKKGNGFSATWEHD